MPANGPRVPGGSARVSRRACRMSLSSWSSTRSESYVFRTFQSIPAPIREAISFGVSTTESGPALVRRLPTLAWPEAVAFGVGAPTAVSATGGNAVERPNQRAPVCRIGSRNHQISASTPMMAIAQPSLSAPLRQPSMSLDLIHRASGLERALHEVYLGDGDCCVEVRSRKDLFEAGEIAGPCIACRAPERDVRPKRPRLGREAQRCERLLDPMLQQLEAGIGRHSRPQHLRPVIVREHAESGDLQRQRAWLLADSGGARQSRHELRLARFLDVTEEF